MVRSLMRLSTKRPPATRPRYFVGARFSEMRTFVPFFLLLLAPSAAWMLHGHLRFPRAIQPAMQLPLKLLQAISASFAVDAEFREKSPPD